MKIETQITRNFGIWPRKFKRKVRTTMAYVEKIRAVSKLLAYLIIISKS